MKKITGILLCIFLICGLTVCFASAENVDGTVTMSSVTAYPGEKAEVFFNLECADGIKTLSLLDFDYDKTALTVIEDECEWLADGKLKDIDFDNNASIITFEENTVYSGSVLKLVFLVSEKAQTKSIPIACNAVATRMINNVETQISLGVSGGAVTVIKDCAHSGGTATCKEKAECSACGEEYGETNPNNHKALTILKAVSATCTKTGLTEGKKCADCGKVTVAQKTVAKKSHTYKSVTTKATLSKNGKVESKCSVCSYVSKRTTVYYPKTIKLSTTSYTYNGKVKTPSVTVKDSKGNALKKDTDYTVSYSSGRKNTGKYTVTIAFKGKYSGKKVLYFNILPSKTSKITPTCGTSSIKVSWKKVTGADGYKVELINSKGKIIKTVTTTKTAYTFKKLSKVTTYKIRVRAYKTIDKKKVYSTSSTTITTSTAPAKVTLSKVTAGSNRATPYWKKVSGASGYEVMYSTSSKFKSTKTVTVKKGSSKKTTIKKLTKGKKYYFKVRSYKTVDGKKVYGAWSSVKSVRVK